MTDKNALGKERLTWIYTHMVRIREFEERVKRTFTDHFGFVAHAWQRSRMVSPRSRSSR